MPKPKTKNCELCGTEFTPSKLHETTQKYCSAKCKFKAHRQKNALRRGFKWQLCNGIGCGKNFIPERKGQRYCSAECAHEAKKRKRRKYLDPINCGVCGVEFIPKRTTQRYCGRYCYDEARNRRRRKDFESIKCKECGAEFKPYKSDTLYCSQACRRRDYYRRYEVSKRQRESKQCAECGVEFTPVKNQRFCTSTCRRRNQRKRWLSDPENVEKLKRARRRWREANPDYAAKADRIRRRRLKLKKEQENAA